jgi:cytochrome c peroxidase
MFINKLNYKMRKNKSLWLVFTILIFVSCEQDSPVLEDLYSFKQPAHFPEATYTFDQNPVTENGFNLGRKLFFDPILSRTEAVSCNNCHLQPLAFADAPHHPVSIGVDDRPGIRNSPSLANLAFFEEFFWDGGVTHLDFVPTNAIESHFEMDETLRNVVLKLNQSSTYPELFKAAFDIDTITSPYLLYALSQFMNLMVSDQSKFDLFLTGKSTLTNLELDGYNLFTQKCGTCHSGVLQTDFSYRNNGIDSVFDDLGRGRITEFYLDNGKFRVPSLRNVAKTAPYMHNAKFSSLEEVLEHYSGGVLESSTLDPSLNNGGSLGIPLSASEKSAIISFLNTLTDFEFLADERFFSSQ